MNAEHFDRIVERRLTRREALRGLLGAGVTLYLPRLANQRWLPKPHASGLPFASLPPSRADRLELAEAHRWDLLLRWGDPILHGAPDFDPSRLRAADQAQQFGYNCDYVGLLPSTWGGADPHSGLLVVNHEYTNPELMFPDWDPADASAEQIDYQLAAHGLSIVRVAADLDGRWSVLPRRGRNWRVTGDTPMRISGPAAGHPWLRTAEDPSATRVRGTLGNCSADVTPWGTILTAEENFHPYFGHRRGLPDADPRRASLDRYGFPKDGTDWGFETQHRRFRVDREPGEAFRFGYVVELDPYDPSWTPRKRTALGRLRREGATLGVAKAGNIVLYSGDDIAFERIYKFVSAEPWNSQDRQANRDGDLLDRGTLFAARFHEDGTGSWLPLVQGQGNLQPERGFNSQADVCINTVVAADAVGATRMDRPEDIAIHPTGGRVYVSMTKNPARGDGAWSGRGPNAANPRKANHWGHVIEIEEAEGDLAATRFHWRFLLICGDPADDSTYFAGYPKDGVSAIACPDNLRFDPLGRLWIATDGQPGALGMNDGLYMVEVDGPARGCVRRFMNGVPGAEISGPVFNRNGDTLFLSIQHPGEGGSLSEPISRWPDAGPLPRPSVIALRSDDGRIVGTAKQDPSAGPLIRKQDERR